MPEPNELENILRDLQSMTPREVTLEASPPVVIPTEVVLAEKERELLLHEQKCEMLEGNFIEDRVQVQSVLNILIEEYRSNPKECRTATIEAMQALLVAKLNSGSEMARLLDSRTKRLAVYNGKTSGTNLNVAVGVVSNESAAQVKELLAKPLADDEHL